MVQALLHNLLSREPFRGGWHTICLLDTAGHIVASRILTQAQVDDSMQTLGTHGESEFIIRYAHDDCERPRVRLGALEWRTGGEARRPVGIKRFKRFSPPIDLVYKDSIVVTWRVTASDMEARR